MGKDSPAGHKISNICHCTGGRIEAPRSSAEGAEGCGVWGGSPLGVGSGEGAQPPPQKIFGFLISKW